MAPNATATDLLELVFDELGERAAGTVTDAVVGDRLLGVELDDGARHGVAHRPPGEVPTLPSDAAELARWSFAPPTGGAAGRAMGIATLNALSAGTVDWQVGDPMAALTGDVDRIATVGLFRAAFRKFDAVEVRVVERREVEPVAAPDGVSVSVFSPDEHAAAFDGVEVLFVTGSSLVYGGIGDYLRAAAEVPTVVLIGATASFLPGPAFDAGVTLLAGARVTDADRVRAGIEAGLCGTDLHDRGLEKVYVASGADRPGLALD